MEPSRSLRKPVRWNVEAIVWKSALFGLALSSLPHLPPALLSEKLSSLLPVIGGRVLKVLWGSTVLYHLNGIFSHVATNSWKSRKWEADKEIVVVTGGSSGIGKLVAEGFAKRGCKVVVFDLNEGKEGYGPNTSFFKVDVNSSSSINEAAVQIRKQVGEPTVLINNAGIGFGGTILEAPEKNIRATLNVNLVAHFLTVKEFLPAMIKKNAGHVVTIASMASFVTIAQNVDYSCSKVAALAFHEGLRQELNHRYDAPMVRTTVVHPLWVRTPLVAPMEKLSKNFPKVLLDAQDVANVIVAQVVSGHGAQIVLPGHLSIASLLRGFPHWLQEHIRGNQKAQISAK